MGVPLFRGVNVRPPDALPTMTALLADATLYLTVVWTVALLLLILGMWLIWRVVHRERYLGTRAHTQLPVRHRREDVQRPTRRIDHGSVARARAMIPLERLAEPAELARET